MRKVSAKFTELLREFHPIRNTGVQPFAKQESQTEKLGFMGPSLFKSVGQLQIVVFHTKVRKYSNPREMQLILSRTLFNPNKDMNKEMIKKLKKELKGLSPEERMLALMVALANGVSKENA
jgi:hypothetical protein